MTLEEEYKIWEAMDRQAAMGLENVSKEELQKTLDDMIRLLAHLESEARRP